MNLLQYKRYIDLDGKNVKLKRLFGPPEIISLFLSFLFFSLPLSTLIGTAVPGGLGTGLAFFVLFGGPLFLPYLVSEKIKKEIKKINRIKQPPHKIIDGFLKWEKGDDVLFEHRINNTKKRMKYFGVTEDYHVAFNKNSFFAENPNPKNLIALPPLYVARHMEKNRDLKKRFKKQKGKQIKQSTSGSYQEFLEILNEEKKKIS